MEKLLKPLGQKSYGSIPHLPGSRVGSGDYHISSGQAKIATEKKRDKNDIVIVQEKLDGSNVGIAKINGYIVALSRSGYTAADSPFKVHKVFAKWVAENEARFSELLKEGERLCGEWLGMAVGTKYDLVHEPFVAFDLMTKTIRTPYLQFADRVVPFDFILPRLISYGPCFSVEAMMKEIQISGHGAQEAVEGAIWRIERNDKVDFLTKYVRHDKEDGKYFAEKTGQADIWNIDVSKYI